MNKPKEIIADKVTPISWNLMVSAVIDGALFAAQFLVLGQSVILMDSKCGTLGVRLLTVAMTKAARELALKQICSKDPMFAYLMWKGRFAITQAPLR